MPYGAPTEPLGVIRSPAATVRFDDMSLIIYPRQRPGRLVSSTGHVVDHLGLSVQDLRDTRAALIEGPDSIVIELVEQR
jgi:hypothetical protein